MKVARLRVSLGDREQLSYTFDEGSMAPCSAKGPLRRALVDYDAPRRAVWARHLSDGSDLVTRAAPLFIRTVLPEASQVIDAALRRWTRVDNEPRLLCVHFDVQESGLLDLLSFLPWELLPAALGASKLLVARKGPVEIARTYAGNVAPQLGLVGAPARRGVPAIGDGEVIGLERRFGKRLKATRLLAETPGDLLVKLEASGGNFLHFSTPAIHHEGTDAELLLSESAAAQAPLWLSAQRLGEHLGAATPCRLAFFNGPQSGPRAARLFSLATGAVSIGWLGHIDSDTAAQLAVAFYDRMVGGSTLHGALLDLLKLLPPRRAGCLPVLWLNAPEDGGQRLPSGSSISGYESFRAGSCPVDIKLPSLLNPSTFRSGTAAVSNLTVDRDAMAEIRGARSIRIQIECDTGIGKSMCSQVIEGGSGTLPVDVSSFRFPALQELARQRVDRRDILFTSRLVADNLVVFEETRAAVWMGYCEWLDSQAEWPYLPAYVQPESAAVKDILDRAQALLPAEGDRHGAFVGYDGGAGAGVTAQLRAFYEALQGPPFELGYIGPGSRVMAFEGSTAVGGQVVRLADEVVAHRRGTCHDLTLLLVGCAEHVRLSPLVILQDGHTFAGFWRDVEAQQQFWSSRRFETFGDSWLLRDAQELRRLVQSGKVIVVEATDITRPSIPFEDACRHAQALAERSDLHVAVDIVMARAEVQAL